MTVKTEILKNLNWGKSIFDISRPKISKKKIPERLYLVSVLTDSTMIRTVNKHFLKKI